MPRRTPPAGTVMAFTPAMPVGLGLLAAGAGVGVTTATGDAIGQHMQKEDVRTRLATLSAAEEAVHHQLRALISFSFPHVPPDDFVEASAPLRFEAVLPEDLALVAALHVSGATARVAPALLSRVGFAVASRMLSVVGAVVSSGDFVHSILTNSPNRAMLVQVQRYLEGVAETFRSWWVLLCHWLGQSPPSPQRLAPQQQRAGAEGANEGAAASELLLQDESASELRANTLVALESRLSDDLTSRFDDVAE